MTVETTPAFFSGLGQLEDHSQRGLVRQASLASHGAVTNRCECAFGDVRRTQMLPVLGREVVKDQQRLAILNETFDRLLVFDAPGLDEGIEGCERIPLGLGHPDLLQRALGLRLLTLRQLVQHIRGLVHPAALAEGLRPYFLDGLPEAERSVGNSKLRSHGKAAPFEIKKQLLPGLRALTHAIDQADELLLALRRRPDDNQQALRRVLQPSLHVDAVHPKVDVAFGRQIAPAPTHMLLRPGLLEPGHRRSRQPAGVFAEERRERLLEVAGRDAFEVEDRRQFFFEAGLRGLNSDGDEFFYTGKAGDGWVSEDRSKAFGYWTEERARGRAMTFNQFCPVHGFWFVVVKQ